LLFEKEQSLNHIMFVLFMI